MIPKIIHYIWLGEKPIPQIVNENNKILGKDWKVKIWTNKDFTFEECQYVKEAYSLGLYMYCSDALRFYILNKFGGVYLDCDVKLHKTPDELLNLKYAIGNEKYYNFSVNSGIMLSEPNNDVIKMFWNYYSSMKLINNGYYKQENDTDKLRRILSSKDKIIVNSIEEYQNNVDDKICIFKNDGWENYNQTLNYSFCEHLHHCTWSDCRKPHGNLIKINQKTNNNKIVVFICGHKPIENYIPKNDKYVILDVTGNVDNSFNDNFHEIIDISQDKFVKEHNVSYSEGCAMYWLWKHPDIIPEYICFGHYRRYFTEFVNFEDYMIDTINHCGSIVSEPLNHRNEPDKKYNKGGMYNDHPKDDIDAFINSVKETIPEYLETFNTLLEDNYQYPFNCFAMKKENFLEMCEMCFAVLDAFNKKQGYKNNEDVKLKMIKQSEKEKLYLGVNWQSRLHGFLLEWLTELYNRHKFNIDNCYKTKASIIKTFNEKKIII